MGNLTATAPFSERLDACATAGSLSTADLAEWFQIAYATMRKWRRGVEPYPARRRQIEERLAWLEDAVRHHRDLPVPLRVRASERKAHVQGVLRSYDAH